MTFTEAEEAWLAGNPVIRLAVTNFIEPVDIVDDQGNYTGLNADLIALLNSKLGINIVPEFQSTWGDVVEKTMTGQVDGAFSLSQTPEREKNILFTKPYAFDPIIVLVRKDERGIAAWNDMSGKTVSVVKGASVIDDIKKVLGDGNLIEVENETAGLKGLADGKVAAHVSWLIPYGNVLRADPVPGLRIAVKRNTEGGTLRLGIHKSQPELYSVIRKGLNAITREELAGVRNRWLSPKAEDSKKLAALDLTSEETAWIKKHKKVRVMVGTWPPFQFMEGGEARGLAIDYVRRVLKSLGLEFEPVPIKWHDALESITSDEVTIDLLPTIARSPEREKLVGFTQDYLSFPRVIFARKEDGFASLVDLYGKRVAVEKNFILEKLISKDHPEISLLPAATTREAIEAVSFGKADAYVGNMAVGSYLIEKLGLVNLKVAARTSYKSDIQAMGVRKDWPELASLIDKALAAIPEKQKRSLQGRYLSLEGLESAKGSGDSQTDPLALVIQIGGGALALIALLLVMSVMVKGLDAKDGSKLYESREVKGLGIVLGCVFMAIVILSAWFTVQSAGQMARKEIGATLRAILQTMHEAHRIWIDGKKHQLMMITGDPVFISISLTEKLLGVPRNPVDLLASPQFASVRKVLSKR